MNARLIVEYRMQFKNGGVWMETNDFIQLVRELGDRFGLDANVKPEPDGSTFSLREKQDQ